MNQEIRVWGDGKKNLWTKDGPVDVPEQFVEVAVGDAYFTHQVKLRADTVYVRMKRDRRFSKAVALLAPKKAVEAARVQAENTAAEREAKRNKRTSSGSLAIARAYLALASLYPAMPPLDLATLVDELGPELLGADALRIHIVVRAHIKRAHCNEMNARDAQRRIESFAKAWRVDDIDDIDDA